MRRNFDFDGNTDGEFAEPEYGQDAYDNDDFMDDMEAEFERLGLIEAELNQKLLALAIEIAKDNFFWILMPLATKLKRIQTIYNSLNELIQSEVDDDADV